MGVSYFHLKQAIRKKLIKYKISSLNMSIILSQMELLTQISHGEINDSIIYIQTFLVEREVLQEFWSYFRQIWLIIFDPSLWNVSEVESA
ncbi:hypothetical protein HZS_2628 [Henneguya salminicola]|nr:hypothetical protein HZS_2628 [Henneguya salminicola]